MRMLLRLTALAGFTLVLAWLDGADAAMRYYDLITRTGWPAETRGVANPYAGKTFPFEAQ